jgi:hypothetical protein
MLCKYKDALGVPRKGIHALRIPWVDLAAVDVIGTLVIAVAVAKWLEVSFLTSLIVVMLLAIALHRVFCVDTRVAVAIFGNT